MARIRLDRVLFPKPVPAGCNYLLIAALALRYRSTNEDVEPILVTREGHYYRITDGRHRVMASIIAGRRRVLATVEGETGG